MKVLVVGSGGREHAIAWKLHQSPSVTKIFCAPGNPGTAAVGKNVPINVDQQEDLIAFAKDQSIDLTFVGPEAPLVDGLADRLSEEGLRVAGPSQGAAQLEGSKAFAKDFMANHGIPTAAYRVFNDEESAEGALESGAFSYPVVLKADGLAAGKGVFICADLGEATSALDEIMHARRFGAAGDRLVVEEFLEGIEASFMVFSDGSRALPMVPSRDHKAAHDGDVGPNTGGMGAYSIDSILDDATRETVLSQVIQPTLDGMKKAGHPFVGILYAGLMLTSGGPKVLEFNVRFGDPETQVVLPRLESDFAEILVAMADGDLSGVSADWSPAPVVSVVIASGGYPGEYTTGEPISGLDLAEEGDDMVVFHAGTALKDGTLVTSGGRVLNVTARAESLGEAIIRAYEGVNKIHFQGMYCRRDIAAKGLGGGID